jgi:hypothetical protein
MKRIIINSVDFTIVDKEDNTAHRVHQSVKQHLFEPQYSHSAEFMEPDLDKQSWYLCMTHLDLKRENEVRGLLFR